MPIDTSSKRVRSNVVATVFQVLVSGIVFFVLYRYLYDRLGIELIGVWSLVIATTSVSRIGELGLSAGVVKYVAQALGQGNEDRASDIVQTIALTLAVFMGFLLVVTYPLFIIGLEYLLPTHGIPVALEILPYALCSLWLMVIISVFSGGLDGCMHMDLRSFIMMGSHLLYLGLALWLVPIYGLEGVAMAQLIQSISLLIVLWYSLKFYLIRLPFMPLYWRFSILKDMFQYGVNFQIISIMNMLFDPMVKVMMSKFGGLETLGYYEMASRLVAQGRALIVEGKIVMVPAMASINKNTEGKAKLLFIKSYEINFFVSLVGFTLLAVCVPSVSILWIGHYEETFVKYAVLLSFGWFINTLIGPAYFSNLGLGVLRDNLLCHITMTTVFLLTVPLFGVFYLGDGVVISMIFAIVTGSVLFLWLYLYKYELLGEIAIVSGRFMLLLVGAFTLIMISNTALYWMYSNTIIFSISFFCSIAFSLFCWNHPVRRILTSKIQEGIDK